MKKITVFIITYNQEKVIRRTLDSILQQKEWGLHQIVIGDDCSADSTFDILLEYNQKFPDIVRPFRNEKNLGIYGNLYNTVMHRDQSDLYAFCAGDDAFCDGFFQAVQKYIDDNKIDTSGKIGIYSDWKAINPSGEERVYRQKIVSENYNLWSLHMRNMIGNRSLIFSKPVIDAYRPAILDRGLHLAEGMFDSQTARTIEYAYYLPGVSSVYYTGIGVSSSLSKTGYATEENIVKWNYYIDNFISEKRDFFYAKYQIVQSEYLIKPGIKKLCAVITYYLRGLYPVSCKNIMSVFVIGLRLLRYAVLYKKQ